MKLIVQRGMMPLVTLATSVLIAACGARCSNPSPETFTVYEDAPKMNPLDLGESGNSPGDAYHFFAPLHSSPGGPVTGEVFGSKTLIKLVTDANPDSEKRSTVLFFTFGDHQDQIVVFGITDYSPQAGEFAAGRPVVRPIFGWHWQIYGRAWATHEHTECRWLLHPGIHLTQVISETKLGGAAITVVGF